MRPTILIAALLAVLCFAPAASAATPPLVGIGEQGTQIFTDPSWQALGLKDVRVVASYDALDSSWQRADLDSYMAAARAAGARVLLSFGHSRIQGNDLLRGGQKWIDVDFLDPALVHDQLTESHEQFFQSTDIDRFLPPHSVE